MELVVSSTPARLADGLGIAAQITPGRRTVIWLGILQNAGPAPVFLRRSATAPDPLADLGFRYGRSERWRQTEYSDHPDGPVWMWTGAREAVLVAESGDPGA